MAHGPRRDPGKERFWRQTLRDWRRSGLGVRDFCSKHQLSEPVFYAWRRTLALRDVAEGDGDGVSRKASDSRRRAAAATFVPVEVVDPVSAIEIVVGPGRVVRVTAGFDQATLVRVVAALEAGSC